MIYFITARDLGRVKIGLSANPDGRLSKMQSDCPVVLKFEKVCAGETEEEVDLHNRFSAHRIHGEWFNLVPEIEDHMATLPTPVRPAKELSVGQMITRATGCSAGYASQMLSDKYPHVVTIPVALSVYRAFGARIGPIESATDQEIDTLEKFCGLYSARQTGAAA